MNNPRCKYPLCQNTAYYNDKLEEYQRKRKDGKDIQSLPPLFCGEHKWPDMIDVSIPCCSAIRCKQIAYYNRKGHIGVTNTVEKKWCYEHYKEQLGLKKDELFPRSKFFFWKNY